MVPFNKIVPCAALCVMIAACSAPQAKKKGPAKAEDVEASTWFNTEALDLMNFTLKWPLPTQRRNFISMTLQGGALYAVTSDHTLYSIDIDSGIVNWVYTIGRPLTADPVLYKYKQDPDSVLVRYDEILLLSRDRLLVVDKDTGERKWWVDLPFPTSSPPTGTAENVLVGSWDDRVYAVKKDAPHGEVWKWRTGGDIVAGGVEYEPVYIAVSRDGWIYAFNQVRGEFRWKKQTRGPIEARPVAYQDKLYVVSMDYSMYCYDLQASVREWRFETGGPIRQSPVVIGDKIYVVSDDRVLSAVHRVRGTKDGKEFVAGDKAWDLVLGRENFDRSARIKILTRGRDLLYVLNERKEIVAIDDATGVARWKVPFSGASFFVTNDNNPGSHSEAIRNRSGTIFLGFRNGRFFALKEKSDY